MGAIAPKGISWGKLSKRSYLGVIVQEAKVWGVIVLGGISWGSIVRGVVVQGVMSGYRFLLI